MGPSRLSIALRRLYHAVGDLHWTVLLGVLVAHMLASWLLLRAAGEADLGPPITFLYYYATTATTVGYGDLTPKSDMGRLATSFFIFPGAIAAFTTLIAKAFGGLSTSWRRRRQGGGDYARMTGGVVLVGYDPDRTPRMIDELVADGATRIVLLATQELDNDDERFRYVRARSLTAPADLARAGAANADKIVVFGANDAETLSAGLAVTAVSNNGGHIVCFFHDEENARLLTAHCPEVEVVLARSVELVVKALNDPGSSHLLAQLVSHTDEGATLFSMAAGEAGSFRQAADALADRGAILLATAPAADRTAFRFDVGGTVAAGDRLFYVAARRLTSDNSSPSHQTPRRAGAAPA